jgi:hypothetical protein
MHQTRRDLLGGATGFATAKLIGTPPFAARRQAQSKLFAFRSCVSGNLVFAVVTPFRTDISVRVHTGVRSWTIVNGRTVDDDRARVFSGEVAWPGASAGRPYYATVLERCPDFVPMRKTLQVWAELRGPDGVRVRIGSPFAADLFSSDTALSVAYHAARPDLDRQLFSTAATDHVIRLAALDGQAEAHARRLVGMLLPDVIQYRTDLPTGFSFAARNGCHPADDTAAVTQTMLRGSVMPFAACKTVPMQDQYPYFLPKSELS